MKTFLVSLVLTLAVAASVIVIVDRFQGPDAGPDAGLGERMAALERGLAAVEDAVMALRPPTPVPDPSPGSGREPGADGPSLTTLKQQLDDLTDMVFDAERGLRRDLMRMHENLTRRLDEVVATGGSRGPALSPEEAQKVLREKIAEMGVRLDAEKHRLEIDAVVAQPNRALELFAVAEGGRIHESLLLLKAVPSALKIGLEDLGLAEAGEPDVESGEWPGTPDGAYLYVRIDGQPSPRRAEDLVLNRGTGASMERTKWVFTASRMFTDHRTWETLFAADVYRNVIALTRNYSEDAVLASPLKDAWDENIWFPNEGVAPAPGTAVTLIVCREPDPAWDAVK